MAKSNTPNLGLTVVEKSDFYNYIEQHRGNYEKIDTFAGKATKNFNTAAETKATTHLVIGDRIQLWGYENLFDKSNHKRVVSDIDDGSGLLLDNGLYANIISDGKVNIKWFGCKEGSYDNFNILQKIVNYSQIKGYEAKIPIGEFYSSGTIKTFNEVRQLTTGVNDGFKITGDGKESVIRGGGKSVANYVNGVNNVEGCVFAIHKSNVIIENFCVKESPVGIYFGGDNRVADGKTHVSLCKTKNMWFESCGTSILLQPGKTVYYNTFEDIQVQGGQIAIHLGLPLYHNNPNIDTSLWVNNRNFFSRITINNTWAGFLVQNGDSCTASSCNFESINGATHATNPWAIGGLPSQINDSDAKATAIFTDDTAHPYGLNDWKFINCHAEANSRDIRLDSKGWGFFDSEFDMDKIDISTLARSEYPIYISNGAPYQAGKFSANSQRFLHVKGRIGYDPFLPDTGTTSADLGVYIENGLISDYRARGKKFDVATLCPQISSITSGTTKASVLGKILTFSGKIVFDRPSSNTLVITLPFTEQVDDDANGGLMIPLFAKGLGSLEITNAEIRRTQNKLVVSAPNSGWAANGNELHISVNIRILAYNF